MKNLFRTLLAYGRNQPHVVRRNPTWVSQLHVGDMRLHVDKHGAHMGHTRSHVEKCGTHVEHKNPTWKTAEPTWDTETPRGKIRKPCGT